MLQRISIDPAVRYGKPCVRGTRLTVELTHEDVLACLAFAAEREKRLITSAAAV
jgi:uncharacterized protein (DUF433 family)